MSLRLIGILPHHLRSFDDAASVPGVLTKLAPLERAVAEAYWGRSAESLEFMPDGWDTGPSHRPKAEWGESGRVTYRSSADTSVYFGREALILFTVAKWYVARGRAELLAAANRFFAAVATEIGASRFLVYHDACGVVDDHVRSGMTYNEVKAAIVDAGGRRALKMIDLALDKAQLERAATAPDLFYEEILATDAV